MSLDGILVIFIFGFPAGLISLVLSALAIWKKWPWLLVVAGLPAISGTLYLGLGSGIPFYLMSLLQFYGAYALRKGNIRLAWALLIPLSLFTAYITFYSITAILQASR